MTTKELSERIGVIEECLIAFNKSMRDIIYSELEKPKSLKNREYWIDKIHQQHD